MNRNAAALLRQSYNATLLKSLFIGIVFCLTSACGPSMPPLQAPIPASLKVACPTAALLPARTDMGTLAQHDADTVRKLRVCWARQHALAAAIDASEAK